MKPNSIVICKYWTRECIDATYDMSDGFKSHKFRCPAPLIARGSFRIGHSDWSCSMVKCGIFHCVKPEKEGKLVGVNPRNIDRYFIEINKNK